MCKKILLFCLLGNKLLYSQKAQEIETDRPDQTECSSVIPRKTFQVETGISLEYDRYQGKERLKQNYASSLFRFGLSPNIEFRLVAGEYEKSRESFINEVTAVEGFKPIEIGTKIFICKENGIIPQTSFLMHLELPLAGKPYQGESVLPFFRFSMSHTLSDKVDLGYNLGMEWESGDFPPLYVYTFTIAGELGKKTGLYLETFGNFMKKEFPESNVDGGFTYCPIPNFQMDASVGFGLNAYTPDYYISAGFSFRLPH